MRKKRSELKQTEEEYTARFLQPRKVKDYSPVYIDIRLKDKLNSLVNSLQYLSPEVTTTVLLSNLLADHIAANKELIKRAASEGLKRSLENTFNEKD
ncbi:MAG: DUF3408 domain-containing protein [Alistipes sp.]|nr:DUF3408 domain-containing protein [Alistipes sp.]